MAMLPEYFAIIGAAIASVGAVYYLYETILGKAKPNRVTFLLWGLFPMVTFIAQRVQGVEGVSWATFVAALMPWFILAASFVNKKAYWKTRMVDYWCMVIGIAGIVLWAITDNPNLAILFTIFADAAAGFPTVLKAYSHPETESWIAFAISTFGFTVAMLAIPAWTFANYAFIVYLVAANALIAILAVRKKSKDPLETEIA